MIKRILILLCVLFMGAVLFIFIITAPLKIPKEGLVLNVTPGSSVYVISKTLAHEKVIKIPLSFMLNVYLEGAWSQLKAGEYFVKPGTTTHELIVQLREGRVIQHSLTIVPGWTFDRLLKEINQNPVLAHTLVNVPTSEVMKKLGLAGQDPEGQFFPDTYYFTRGTRDVVFLKRANILLHQKLNALFANRDPLYPLQSPYEALILASIIEKETDVLEEYPEISGVFIRRLAKKMPLQADPTVIYGLGEAYTGTITAEMLAKPTPYNTYQNLHLPPTPIALPSEKALFAAIHPSPGESLYFVAKKEGKGHVFSKTLTEHQAAVAQYRARSGEK